ncbi:MAG: hypothetical protein LIO91_00650, partial [Bacteroidales bacterium]|nr:hypothetical protein [Bacteroidales bacterium]
FAEFLFTEIADAKLPITPSPSPASPLPQRPPQQTAGHGGLPLEGMEACCWKGWRLVAGREGGLLLEGPWATAANRGARWLVAGREGGLLVEGREA